MYNKTSVFVSFVVLLVLSVNIKADDLPDCKNPQGSYATGYCSEQEFKRSDKKLNIVYQTLKKKLNKEQSEILLSSQRGWIKLRDNDCELEQYYSRGTTGWYTYFLDCQVKKTKIRIQELESFIEYADLEAPIDR